MQVIPRPVPIIDPGRPRRGIVLGNSLFHPGEPRPGREPARVLQSWAFQRDGRPSSRPCEDFLVYSVHRLDTDTTIGPARSLDHALLLTDVGGPGRYEVQLIGDVPRHLCLITRAEDGTFLVDPRRAGGLAAALSTTLTRA